MRGLQKWAYKIIGLVKATEKRQSKIERSERWILASDLEEALNKLGAQGWELVDVKFFLDGRETIVAGFSNVLFNFILG